MTARSEARLFPSLVVIWPINAFSQSQDSDGDVGEGLPLSPPSPPRGALLRPRDVTAGLAGAPLSGKVHVLVD